MNRHVMLFYISFLVELVIIMYCANCYREEFALFTVHLSEPLCLYQCCNGFNVWIFCYLDTTARKHAIALNLGLSMKK